MAGGAENGTAIRRDERFLSLSRGAKRGGNDAAGFLITPSVAPRGLLRPDYRRFSISTSS